MPTFDQVIDFIIGPIQVLFLIFPIVSVYVTYVHYQWWKAYRPSPLIKHLLISSIAVDVAGVLSAIIVMNIWHLFPFSFPSGVNTLLLAAALGISLSVKVWRRFALRRLDNPKSEGAERDIANQE